MRIEQTSYNLNGKNLILRSAQKEDAALLIDFLKTVCGETRFLVKEPEEITLTMEEEIKFIEKQNSSEYDWMILGFLDGEFVGNCSLMKKRALRQCHRAEIGIALYQRFTGMGIGRIMLKKLCETAKEHHVEQLELEVNADNERAISLYENLGFERKGIFPDNLRFRDGTYIDAYWMCKKFF